MRLIGAIDEGTSSARFIIFKAQTSEIVASHQEELKRIYPREGWVEQDPIIILNTVNKCIDKAVSNLIESGGDVNDIICIGITNQRESTIVWDKISGKPLHNSIVWLDMRTTSTVDTLLDDVPNKTRNKNYLKPLCGLPLSPYFSAVKLKWLQENVPTVKKAIDEKRCLFGTVDSWLIWNLTGGKDDGVHATDVTNASRTMLMNIDTLKWDPFLLKFFSIDENVLPKIRSSSEVYGLIKNGPLAGIPISGCLGDQQSALVGQQCLEKGQVKCTYGTGCFLLYNTGIARINSKHGLVTTIAYQFGPKEHAVYALEGSVAVAGAAITWLRDGLSVLDDFSDTQALAEEAQLVDGGDVYFVPAFSGLYAPYWRQDARGVICGITAETKSSHIVRATLDAVCFQTRDILDAMVKDYSTHLQKILVDGGMTSNSMLMQLQADLTGLTVLKPIMAESTALGAAIAAGIGIDAWDITKPLHMETKSWTPKYTSDERDVRHQKWKMAVEKSLGWDI